MRFLILAAGVLLGASACTGGEKSADSATAADTPASAAPSPQNTDRVRTAATVANAIAARPSAADSILIAAGMTRDSFQKLMYEIAADSAMSAAYAAAKTR